MLSMGRTPSSFILNPPFLVKTSYLMGARTQSLLVGLHSLVLLSYPTTLRWIQELTSKTSRMCTTGTPASLSMASSWSDGRIGGFLFVVVIAWLILTIMTQPQTSQHRCKLLIISHFSNCLFVQCFQLQIKPPALVNIVKMSMLWNWTYCFIGLACRH